MNIREIEILNDLKDAKETLSLWRNFSKYLNIKKGKIDFNNDEIDVLISFFSEREHFEICNKLIKYKNNL